MLINEYTNNQQQQQNNESNDRDISSNLFNIKL